MRNPFRRTTALAAAILASTATVTVPPTAVAAPACEDSRWVGSWAAAPSDGKGLNLVRPLLAQTVRMVVHPTLSGDTVRIRLSNRYGAGTARISSATVGVRSQGAAIVPGTLRKLTFDGAGSVDLAAGTDRSSDATSVPVRAGQDLVVSLHVPGLVLQPTEHYITNQTNYLSLSGLGDQTGRLDATAFPLTTSTVFSNGWYFLAGVDVHAERRSRAVVAFGDSITDGFQGQGLLPGLEGRAGWDANVRYPDFLAARLQAAGGPDVAVLNAGISGNRVLADAAAPWPYGASALRRFEDDALSAPGVSDIVILEGINDLGSDEQVTPVQVIAGLTHLVDAAHARGLRVHLGTLTPSYGASGIYGTTSTALRRQAVNLWIRTSGVADSVIDFDKAIRDPAQPSRMLPAYDSGDHLHPSTEGYRAMAAAVPLNALAGADSCVND